MLHNKQQRRLSPTKHTKSSVKRSSNRNFVNKNKRHISNKTSMSDSLKIFTKDSPVLPNFDYVVVGGGSGGISSSRRAASYGAKVCY